MTFRLTTLLYLFALVAASMAVLGAWGLLLGVWFFCWWWKIKSDSRGFASWPNACAFIVAFGLLPGVLFSLRLDSVVDNGPVRRVDHLRQLGRAIQLYHQDQGHFPSPYTTDDGGRPLASWRTNVLPYVGEYALSQRFNHKESWDTPANLQLLADIEVFIDPRSQRTVTGECHFFGVVGPGTCFDTEQVVSLSDISDGPDRTVMLIAGPPRRIRWSEPRDITIDEAVDLLSGAATAMQTRPGYFVTRHFEVQKNEGHYLGMADGSVRWLPNGISREDAKALCTRAGGERLKPFDDAHWTPKPLVNSSSYLQPPKLVKTQLHWGRIWGLVFWIAIILLPFNRRLNIFPTKPT
jgi:hypothetical protein